MPTSKELPTRVAIPIRNRSLGLMVEGADSRITKLSPANFAALVHRTDGSRKLTAYYRDRRIIAVEGAGGFLHKVDPARQLALYISSGYLGNIVHLAPLVIPIRLKQPRKRSAPPSPTKPTT